MNALHIQSVFNTDRKLKEIFMWIYPADRLPKSINRLPSALIANVDHHNEPGSHWVLIYISKYGHSYFMDSFGRHPALCSLHFKIFLDNHTHEWSFNTRSLYSPIGPLYAVNTVCIYFLIHRVKGNSMSSIVSRFTLNRTQNDRKVYAFINSRHQLNVWCRLYFARTCSRLSLK